MAVSYFINSGGMDAFSVMINRLEESPATIPFMFLKHLLGLFYNMSKQNMLVQPDLYEKMYQSK